MFGLGFTEIFVLVLIAFLVFGPKQFPFIAQNFIKLLNELKSAWTEMNTEFYDVQTEAQKQIQQITNDVEKDLDVMKDIQLSSDTKNKNNGSTKKV